MRYLNCFLIVFCVFALTSCAAITENIGEAETKVQSIEEQYNQEVRTEAIKLIDRAETEYTTVRQRVEQSFHEYCGTNDPNCQADLNGDGLQDVIYRARKAGTISDTAWEIAVKVDDKVRNLRSELIEKDQEIQQKWSKLKSELKKHDTTIQETFDKVYTILDDTREYNEKVRLAIEGVTEVAKVVAKNGIN